MRVEDDACPSPPPSPHRWHPSLQARAYHSASHLTLPTGGTYCACKCSPHHPLSAQRDIRCACKCSPHHPLSPQATLAVHASAHHCVPPLHSQAACGGKACAMSGSKRGRFCEAKDSGRAGMQMGCVVARHVRGERLRCRPNARDESKRTWPMEQALYEEMLQCVDRCVALCGA